MEIQVNLNRLRPGIRYLFKRSRLDTTFHTITSSPPEITGTFVSYLSHDNIYRSGIKITNYTINGIQQDGM